MLCVVQLHQTDHDCKSSLWRRNRFKAAANTRRGDVGGCSATGGSSTNTTTSYRAGSHTRICVRARAHVPPRWSVCASIREESIICDASRQSPLCVSICFLPSGQNHSPQLKCGRFVFVLRLKPVESQNKKMHTDWFPFRLWNIFFHSTFNPQTRTQESSSDTNTQPSVFAENGNGHKSTDAWQLGASGSG